MWLGMVWPLRRIYEINRVALGMVGMVGSGDLLGDAGGAQVSKRQVKGAPGNQWIDFCKTTTTKHRE
jgi:hypothetical protein